MTRHSRQSSTVDDVTRHPDDDDDDEFDKPRLYIEVFKLHLHARQRKASIDRYCSSVCLYMDPEYTVHGLYWHTNNPYVVDDSGSNFLGESTKQ